jgi:hypothetical protein
MRGRLLVLVSVTAAVILGVAAPVAAKTVCEHGYSKLIASNLVADLWQEFECTGILGKCATGYGSDTQLIWWLSPNPASCSSATDETCDEAKRLNGTLTARLNFRLRENKPCPFRGWYEGPFELTDPDTGVLLATGDIRGTVGVGTHQKLCQGAECTAICENCYDVARDPDTGLWRLASEGTYSGTVIAGPWAGCTLHVSYEGDFFAPDSGFGSPQTPPGWKFAGHADGILECDCVP